ncbi:DUF6296 family protein [Streptomyces sp. NPDC097619]|uniref:DUF6296 family protein n=1 Tax=Streptomyces sp. NPDC097619 TaxID=3157228 RepID=UPI00331986CF
MNAAVSGERDEVLGYEVVFRAVGPAGSAAEDVVRLHRSGATGPGGHPVYEDVTGIVRAEISGRGEVRVLATGGGQRAARVLRVRPLGS